MTRVELLEKIKIRKKELWLTIENIANISELWTKTLTRFFAGNDVKLSTIEKLTFSLWLDLMWNEIIDINTIKKKHWII